MSILDMLKEVKEDIVEVPEHPLADEDVDLKITYLSGIALMSNTDEKIDKDEMKHIEFLIKGMRLPESTKEKIINISKNPSQEQIKQIIETIKENELEYRFLLDTAVALWADKVLEESEKEGFFLFSEMINISKHLSQQFLDFAEVYMEKNEKKVLEVLSDIKGIDKSVFPYYVKQLGVLVLGDENITEGKREIKGKTLRIIGNIIIGKDAEIEFENCNLTFTGGRILSTGNVIMKNCNVKLDQESIISVSNFDCYGCTFSTIGDFEDVEIKSKKSKYNNKEYYSNIEKIDKTILVSITDGENVNIVDTKFKDIKFFNVLYVERTPQLNIEMCTFVNNKNCIYLSNNSGIKIKDSIFKNNSLNDIIYNSHKVETIIDNCNFEKSQESNYLTIYFSYIKRGINTVKNCKFIRGGIYCSEINGLDLRDPFDNFLYLSDAMKISLKHYYKAILISGKLRDIFINCDFCDSVIGQKFL
ncbi:parallel beta-helix repeat (two copies) [Caminicella sporogenes DSM 14501]|uniref:Parallel beta-helix repeat (Two copies) n=1 Tax=Caminicella sporogenes DSM 14501 TaxID=1121266 RepID=A0A1M6REI4_9FIRM|nr:right-handed parallel beta-helix repeat-containing protein [Caminicella sporogenes]RKD25212.1 hypothetical protein BET04_03050 [Caminicella sporogenes]SHK30862.1 parallel beta-helix repeat (two copies) [Caminicella sporogenes DSM 14501]